eukprot:144393-Chlamydomonas_euryale.AAC.3
MTIPVPLPTPVHALVLWLPAQLLSVGPCPCPQNMRRLWAASTHLHAPLDKQPVAGDVAEVACAEPPQLAPGQACMKRLLSHRRLAIVAGCHARAAQPDLANVACGVNAAPRLRVHNRKVAVGQRHAARHVAALVREEVLRRL